MAKRTHGETVIQQQKARTSSGWASLLWILVGALLAVMIGVFLYLSPLFDSYKTDTEVNPPMQVQPLPQQQPVEEYEFYEVLPKREFHTGGSAIGEATSPSEDTQNTEPTNINPDAVVKAQNNPTPTTQNPDITIVQENDTYDNEDIAINSITASTPQTSYILQIRSYDTPEEADRMRAEVMMSGVDARILKRMDNGLMLYQVISNNMTAKEVKVASQRLKDRGIDSLIVEQRH